MDLQQSYIHVNQHTKFASHAMSQTNLAEDKAVPEGMLVITGGSKSLQFGLQCPVEENALQSRSGSCCHTRLVDPVEHSWNGRDIVRLEGLQIFEQSKGITRTKTNAATDTQDAEFLHTLEDIK